MSTVEDLETAALAESFTSTDSFAAGRLEPLYRPGEPLAVSRFTPAEVPDVVKLHVECFPGYLLTGLGESFLRRYYGAVARHPATLGAIARGVESRRVVAFALGTSDAAGVFRSFYRRNLPAIVSIAAVKSITCPVVRRRVIGIARNAPGALRLLAGAKPPAPTVPNQPVARMLSLAAAPPYRGSGAAVLVLRAFEAQVKAAGFDSVGASCKLWNDRLARFLMSNKWRESARNDAGRWFERELV